MRTNARLVALAALTAVVGLFTGVFTNLLSERVPTGLVQLTRPLFAVSAVATVVLTILTVTASTRQPGSRIRVRRVRAVSDPIPLGVHPAEQVGDNLVTAYVRRDVDQQLDRLLGQHGFTLVVGESAAGKSRAAYEAVRRCLPGHLLLIPSGTVPLEDLSPHFARTKKSVLWLDDLERYLGARGLTAALLATMRLDSRSHRHIVATMRSEEMARFTARREKSAVNEHRVDLRDGRTVIDQATVVRIDRLWTSTELARAADHRTDPRIRHALQYGDRFGLAEILADGPELLRDWTEAWRPGAHPRAAALVTAAVDCRRAGMFRPIHLGALQRLHEGYLYERGGAALRPEPFDAALSWACEPLRGHVSLLVEAPAEHYLVFDYLVDRLQQAGQVDEIGDEIWREASQVTDPAEAYSVGVAAQNAGRLPVAALALRKAFNNGIPEAGVRLADCLGELGKVHEAVDIARDAVQLAEQNWGPTHPDTVSAQRVLAHWLTGAGQLQESKQTCIALLRHSVDALGTDHVETIAVRYQLGLTIGLLGDPRMAVELLDDVVAARERILGPDHPDTLLARSLAAWWIGDSGRPAEALALYRQLELDRHRIFGDEDARTLHTRARVAFWTGQAGDLPGSLRLYQHLLADRARILGSDHQHTLHTRSRVSLLTLLNGHATLAAQLFQTVVNDRTRVLGADHPATLISRLLLARATGESGDPAASAAACAALAEDSTRVLGDDHPDTLAARAEYARWLGEAGNAAAAVAELTELIGEYTNLLGAHHPQTLNIRNNFACWLDSAGHTTDAIAMLRALHTQTVGKLGADHPDALLVRHNLAFCLGHNGDLEACLAACQKLIDDCVRVLGDNHQDTWEARALGRYWTGERPLARRCSIEVGPTVDVRGAPPRPMVAPPRAVIEGLGFEPFDLRYRKRP